MRVKSVLMIALVAACGSKQPTGGTTAGGGENGSGSASGVAKDTRTPYMKRRSVACEALGPRLTQCAVDDARADLAAGKVSQKDFDADTAPALQKKLTEKFIEECAVPGTTHQLRVLEVCAKEETECGPLGACLGHINDEVPKKP